MIDLVEIKHDTWKFEFEKLKKVYTTKLHSYPIDIEHVGSTAIAALICKPIIDIDIILYDKTLIPQISSNLEQLGYISKGNQGIEGRFAFKQQSAFVPFTNQYIKWLSHHLYVCFSDSLALKNHLLFKQALLNNQNLVEQYNLLKKKLVAEKGISRELYTKKKTDFILNVLSKLDFSIEEINAIKIANS